MFEGLEIIIEFMNAFVDAMKKLPDSTPEQIADFCKEADISPLEVMGAANYCIRDLEIENAYEAKETFGGVVGYLENNGFVYDKNNNRFREA